MDRRRTRAIVVEFEFEHSRSDGLTYDISPDGRRFLVLKLVNNDEAAAGHVQLLVVQNWLEGLRDLVRVD